MGGPRWVPPRQEEGTPLASPPAATSVAGAVAQVDQKHRIAGVPRAAGGAAVQDPARVYGPTGGRDGHWCWHAELRLDGGVAARGPGEAGAFVDPPWVANPTLSVSRCAEGAAAAALPAARAATESLRRQTLLHQIQLMWRQLAGPLFADVQCLRGVRAQLLRLRRVGALARLDRVDGCNPGIDVVARPARASASLGHGQRCRRRAMRRRRGVGGGLDRHRGRLHDGVHREQPRRTAWEPGVKRAEGQGRTH